MQTPKHTAWRKSRKFGDVYGGRQRTKLADGIINRMHDLLPPGPGQARPIFMVENPSRDFYFPVTPEEIRTVFSKLPKHNLDRLTHVWLRKIKKTEYYTDHSFQGCFISGSGVGLVTLHPFPKDNRMYLGQNKPLQKTIKYYSKYTRELSQGQDGWFLQWTDQAIKDYYLNDLLLHEIGHLVDSLYKRYWSKAGAKRSEDFAESFVGLWGNNFRETEERDGG